MLAALDSEARRQDGGALQAFSYGGQEFKRWSLLRGLSMPYAQGDTTTAQLIWGSRVGLRGLDGAVYSEGNVSQL